MAKLRHVAIAVADIQAAARFYEQTFGMTRLRESQVAVMLTDGTVSLAVIDSNRSAEAAGHRGVHHLGFVADDPEEVARDAEARGAVNADDAGRIALRFANRGDMVDGRVVDAATHQVQLKYRDPNGIPFDIANAAHARNVWKIPG